MDTMTSLLLAGDAFMLALLGLMWWQRRHNRPQ